MRFRDPNPPHNPISREEALRIARERHGRPFRCQERVARETEPSRDLIELNNAGKEAPVILLAERNAK